MKSWKYITLIILILVGGAASFGYWSINQFDRVFDNLSATYLANTHQAYSFLKQRAELASTSPEVLGVIATSTESKLSLAFPQKDTDVYVGCTYSILWKTSTTTNSLEIALVNASTKESIGPKTSGLAKENAIEKESQNLNWKVGFVWPGAYYIKISKINGAEAVFRSKVFEINNMPKSISAAEREKICKES